MSNDKRKNDIDVLLYESSYLAEGAELSSSMISQISRGSTFSACHLLPSPGEFPFHTRNPVSRMLNKVRQYRAMRHALDQIIRPIQCKLKREFGTFETLLYADQPLHFPTQIVRAYLPHAYHVLVPHGIQLFSESCATWINNFRNTKETWHQKVARLIANRIAGMHALAPSEWYWDEEITLNERLGIAPKCGKAECNAASLQPLYNAIDQSKRDDIENQLKAVTNDGSERVLLLLPLGINEDTFDKYLEWFSTAVLTLDGHSQSPIVLKPHPALRDRDSVFRFCKRLSERIQRRVTYLDAMDGLPLELTVIQIPLVGVIGCASGSLYVVHKMKGLKPLVLGKSLEHIANLVPDIYADQEMLFQQNFNFCTVV